MNRGPPPRSGRDSGSSGRHGLPDKLMALFLPNTPIEQKPPLRKKPPTLPLTGVAAYLEHLPKQEAQPEAKEDTGEPRKFRNLEFAAQARIDVPTKAERHELARKEKMAKAAVRREEQERDWDPAKDPKVEGNAYSTLFVGRLSYDLTESALRREFEEYGPIRRIRIVREADTDKPRGYAFIEYKSKDDMVRAYKVADGRKIDGRRLVVDVERGRTVPGWRPTRLGGGKGGESRLPRPKQPKKGAGGRLPPPGPYGGPPRRDDDRGGPPRRDDRMMDRPRRDDGYRPRDRESDRRPPPRHLPGPPRSGSRERDREHRSRDRSRERGEIRDDRRDSHREDRKRGREDYHGSGRGGDHRERDWGRESGEREMKRSRDSHSSFPVSDGRDSRHRESGGHRRRERDY